MLAGVLAGVLVGVLIGVSVYCQNMHRSTGGSGMGEQYTFPFDAVSFWLSSRIAKPMSPFYH